MFFFVVGVVFGFLSCLYYLLILKKNYQKQQEKEEIKGKSLYINFLLLSKDEMIKNKVEEKLQEKIGKGYFRDKITNKISEVAINKIQDHTINEKISKILIEEIPNKINTLGIVTKAIQVYCQGSILIIKLFVFSLFFPIFWTLF